MFERFDSVCACSARRSQKRASDPTGLELLYNISSCLFLFFQSRVSLHIPDCVVLELTVRSG